MVEKVYEIDKEGNLASDKIRVMENEDVFGDNDLTSEVNATVSGGEEESKEVSA